MFYGCKCTVKPVMYVCCIFHELNKSAKLKGTNIDTIPTLIGIVCCLKIVWFEFAKIKGTKIILHVKSPSFTAAKLKCFTILDHVSNAVLKFDHILESVFLGVGLSLGKHGLGLARGSPVVCIVPWMSTTESLNCTPKIAFRKVFGPSSCCQDH